MNSGELQKYVENFWDKEIIPALTEYIKIPCKSPAFDPSWEESGHIEEALQLATNWIKKHKGVNWTIHVERAEGRTPLLLVEVPGEINGSILMYGHLDKQPEMEGWRDGLGPWNPVIEGQKLFGRGSADDGYALFASVAAVKALKEQGQKLPRIIMVVEFCEESGSEDLPYYMDACSDRIGEIDLVVCLDSGVGNYEQFWNTVSLRGMVAVTVRVDVLKQGVHSGYASGLVPSSFRIIRKLLSRIEDEETGQINLPELFTEIPAHRRKEAELMIQTLGGQDEPFPYAGDMKPSTGDPVEGVLKRTWKPALSVIGVDGIPSVKDAGNVLRPYTSLKLSMRIPPLVDGKTAINAIKAVLEKEPPYDAGITIRSSETATGWNAPRNKPWLENAISEASNQFYRKPSMSIGEGGTIPFINLLGRKFPQAQFIVTGVLGPGSNAHGPDEFLHIPYVKKLTGSIAFILSKFPSGKSS